MGRGWTSRGSESVGVSGWGGVVRHLSRFVMGRSWDDGSGSRADEH
jgi:hypothetical protein